jgi:hypothetical protein
LEYFERLKEDMEMCRSEKLPKEIAKARKEKKGYLKVCSPSIIKNIYK